MSIKAVFFDLGGVILELDWLSSFQGAKKIGINSFDSPGALNRFLGSWKPLIQYEAGEIKSADFFQHWRTEFKLNISDSDLKAIWLKIVLRPYPEMNAILSELSEKVTIFALSNTSPSHFEYFINFPEFRHFKKVFTSFDLHSRKPDSAIFLRALSAAGLQPEEVLFIDDSDRNIEAANRLGFATGLSVNSPAETRTILANYKLIKTQD